MFFKDTATTEIYTDVIAKVPVQALVQTSVQLIRGAVHIRQNERVKDELERDEFFLAITDASVLAPDGQSVLHQAPFLAVRRDQIVWIIPLEEEGA